MRGLLALLCASAVCLADGPAPPSKPQREQAIRGGLGYLEHKLFSLPDVQGTPREPFTCAVAGIDFLLARDLRITDAAASDPVKECEDRLLRYLGQVEQDLRDPKKLPQNGVFSSDRLIQYTWPLGMAALFFAEEKLRGVHADQADQAMRRIAAILEDAEQENGGWGHGKTGAAAGDRAGGGGLPQGLPKEAQDMLKGFGGYPNTLLSSTNIVAPAIGVLSKMGIKLAALDKARKYYAAAQLDNGSFPYDPSQRSAQMDETGAPRTAGAIFALLSMGAPIDDPVVAKGRKYLAEHMEFLSEGHGSAAYGLMDGALACRVLGEKEWRDFDGRYAGRIVAKQDKDGAFHCICEKKAFATSCDEEFGMDIGVFADSAKCYLTSIDTLILLLDRTTPKLVGPPSRGGVRTK